MNQLSAATAVWRRSTSEAVEILARWQQYLPDEWRDEVIVALDFKTFSEYEIAAGRCFGYDENASACYYAHDYALEEVRSDDDESFYRVIAYGETVRAWRLRDGRWLNFRQLHGEDNGSPHRAFFSLTESAPTMPKR